jgi:hypothetical protein
MDNTDSYIPAIPLSWLSQAAKLPGKTLQVALTLWYLRSTSDGGAVKLTKKALELFNVNRETAGDAVCRLEEEGLITVDRQPGMKHTVMILAPEPIQPRVQVEQAVQREEPRTQPTGPQTLRGAHNLPSAPKAAPVPHRSLRAQLTT